MPQRCFKDGRPARSAEERGQAAQEHFAEIEGADTVTWQTLEEGHNAWTPPAYDQNNCSREDLPTLTALTQQFAAANRARAPGPDTMLDDMLATAPREAARRLHPLLCKFTLHGAEPLQFKGGLAMGSL